jgi:hypothetical protein
MDGKKYPTPDEVRAVFAEVDRQIDSMKLCLDFTIQDYPFGRRDRGKCRLQVERAKGKGYRTIKTTTDRNGRWCAPKKSTFTNSLIFVVELGDDRGGWLHVGERAVSVGHPAGGGDILTESPNWCKPSREPKTYTTASTKYVRDGNGFRKIGGEEEQTHTIPADPPELCDAWDAWHDCYVRLRTRLASLYGELEGK